MQKTKLGPYPASLSNISNVKWNKELNIKAKTIKLSEGNPGIDLHNVRFDNGFLASTAKAQVTKEKINRTS